MEKQKQSKQIIVKMKEGLYDALIDYCAREHLSISEVVRNLISQHIPKSNQNEQSGMGTSSGTGRNN